MLDNSVGDFGSVQQSFYATGIRKNGAVDAQTGTVLDGLQSIRQRVYYAQPSPEFSSGTPYGAYDHIYRWRYYDSGVVQHINDYDSNFISPYSEFPPNPALVTQYFFSLLARFITFSHEEKVWLNFQCFGKLFESSYADCVFGALKTSNVIRCKMCATCQRLLSKVAYFPIATNVVSNDFVQTHVAKLSVSIDKTI
jgi:hypothetical protein